MMEIVLHIISAASLLMSLIVFFTGFVGSGRFKHALARIHAAALGDTLGIGLLLVSLLTSGLLEGGGAKLVCVLVFLWFTSPVASHVIAKLAVVSDPELHEHVTVEDEEALTRVREA